MKVEIWATALPALLILMFVSGNAAAQPYGAFIAAWNSECEKIGAPAKYLLDGNRARAGVDTRQALESWCAIFPQKESVGCAGELAALADEMPKSSFLVYAAFRDKHWRDAKIALGNPLDSQQLATALNSYLGIRINGRVPDYVAPETVATIIYMNSFRFYLKRNLRKIQRRGIDRGLNSCRALSTGGRYPCLDGWLEPEKP